MATPRTQIRVRVAGERPRLYIAGQGGEGGGGGNAPIGEVR